jgi:putative flippase GtrA
MLYFGMNYAGASLIALVLGILFSFRTQGTFVFYNSDKSRFGRFVLAWSIVYVCNVAFIRAMLGLGFSAYVAGALALPITTFLSYVIQKHFVFHRPPSSPTPPA